MEITYRLAEKKDENSIKELLKKYDLPAEDISDHLNNFIIALADASIVGVIGLEILEKYGLLRSLAVESSYRNRAVGKKLYKRLLAHAHQRGITRLYLLTLTAEKYFRKLGFTHINRQTVPESILTTKEFISLCPDSAICMFKEISPDVKYFPKDTLDLTDDVPGAKMWSVALDKTMFTYFEVETNCMFEMHSHESEQITMVLDGELYFELKETTNLQLSTGHFFSHKDAKSQRVSQRKTNLI